MFYEHKHELCLSTDGYKEIAVVISQPLMFKDLNHSVFKNSTLLILGSFHLKMCIEGLSPCPSMASLNGFRRELVGV